MSKGIGGRCTHPFGYRSTPLVHLAPGQSLLDDVPEPALSLRKGATLDTGDLFLGRRGFLTNPILPENVTHVS